MPDKDSQLSVRYNEYGEKCIYYEEVTVTKTHDRGIADKNRDRKQVWIYPNNDNVDRCPVRLISKYLSLCPETYFKKENFYLQSLQKPTPKHWYGGQVVDQNTLSKVIKKMMEKAEIAGHFTNHSARQTGGTRLFQAGIDRKLVKESTGHCSDAVNKYQITSHERHREMANVLACNGQGNMKGKSSADDEESVQKEVKTLEVKSNSVMVKGPEDKDIAQVDDVINVSNLVFKIINQSKAKGQGKTTIKIEIEICHE